MNKVINFIESQKLRMVNCLNEICFNNNLTAFNSFKEDIQKEITGMIIMYNAIEMENYIPGEEGYKIWQALNNLNNTIESFEFSNKKPDFSNIELKGIKKKIKNANRLIWFYSIGFILLIAIIIYLSTIKVN